LKVTIRNPLYARRAAYFFTVPEFVEYEGEEVAVKWLTGNQLALSTNMPGFPFRVLERDTIVKIDNKDVNFAQAIRRTIVVKGSKGNEYVVTLGARPSCSCPGFQFRKSCKHITEAV